MNKQTLWKQEFDFSIDLETDLGELASKIIKEIEDLVENSLKEAEKTATVILQTGENIIEGTIDLVESTGEAAADLVDDITPDITISTPKVELPKIPIKVDPPVVKIPIPKIPVKVPSPKVRIRIKW